VITEPHVEEQTCSRAELAQKRVPPRPAAVMQPNPDEGIGYSPEHAISMPPEVIQACSMWMISLA
jgi:hypothetical protein